MTLVSSSQLTGGDHGSHLDPLQVDLPCRHGLGQRRRAEELDHILARCRQAIVVRGRDDDRDPFAAPADPLVPARERFVDQAAQPSARFLNLPAAVGALGQAPAMGGSCPKVLLWG
jgi:hypothetical protein